MNKMEFSKKQQGKRYGWVRFHPILFGLITIALYLMLIKLDILPDNIPGMISMAVAMSCGIMAFMASIWLCLKISVFGNMQKQYFSEQGVLEIIIFKERIRYYIDKSLCTVLRYSIMRISKIKVTHTHIIIDGMVLREECFALPLHNLREIHGEISLVNKVYIPRNFTNEAQITGLDIQKYNAKLSIKSIDIDHNVALKRQVNIRPVVVLSIAIVCAVFFIDAVFTEKEYNAQLETAIYDVRSINEASDFLGIELLEEKTVDDARKDPTVEFFTEVNTKREDGRGDLVGGWPENRAGMVEFNGEDLIGNIIINTLSPHFFGIHVGDDYSSAEAVLSKEGYTILGKVTAEEKGGGYRYYMYAFSKNWGGVTIITNKENIIWAIDILVKEPRSGMPLENLPDESLKETWEFLSFDEKNPDTTG